MKLFIVFISSPRLENVSFVSDRTWWWEFLSPFGRKEPDERKSRDRKIASFEFTPVDHTRGYQKVLSLTWKEPEIWIYSALFFNVVPFQLHTLVPSSYPVINTRSVEVNILVP